MEYKILFESSFRRDLKKLPQNIIEKSKLLIEEISKSPLNYEKLSGNLNDVFKCKFKVSQVEYRIAFTVQNNNEIIFLMIAKRENFYNLLKKRICV